MTTPMPPTVSVREFPAQRILAVRTKVPRKEAIAALQQALAEARAYVAAKGAAPAGPPVCVYYEFGAFAVDLEAGYPVAELLSGEGRVRPSVVPAGHAVVAEHTGRYETFSQAHLAAHGWIHQQGKRSKDYPREVYLTDPVDHPYPEEWQTLVIWPIVSPTARQQAAHSEGGNT